MRIAIISDSHDNLPNIYKAIEWMNKNGIQEIIHCGDVCAPAALREMAKNFNGKIHLAYGNVDGDHEGMENVREEFKNVILYEEKGEMEIIKNGEVGEEIEKFPPEADLLQRRISLWLKPLAERNKEIDFGDVVCFKKIGFCHFPFEARKLAESGKYDYVFYGHTHKPWEEMVGKCKLLNPGTLAGMFYKATFAVWNVEEDRVDLKILELL